MREEVLLKLRNLRAELQLLANRTASFSPNHPDSDGPANCMFCRISDIVTQIDKSVEAIDSGN